MRIMYCKFNMFDMNSMVLSVDDAKGTQPLFMGSFDDVSNYMAAEYQTERYDKIVLAGPYAEAVQDRILTYSKTNYNYDNINIEVVE